MPKDNVALFDILSPVMIGPSSSHTAGVARIAFLAGKMFARKPSRAVVLVSAMKSKGDSLPQSLKENSEGGLATTHTGLRCRKLMSGS